MKLKVHFLEIIPLTLTPQEYMFQISNQTVKPFDLEIGEHRDIENSKTIIFIYLFIYLHQTGHLVLISLYESTTHSPTLSETNSFQLKYFYYSTIFVSIIA